MKEGEYRPQHSQPEHAQSLQGRAEGRASLQGPTTVDGSEQLQPQQESSQGNLPVENPWLTKRRRAVFDCALPKPKEPRSLFWIQQMLGSEMLNIEEVPALEQQWLDYLTTMDRQALEETLKKSESKWEHYKDMQKRKQLTAHGQALLPALEEDAALLRAELRQRK